VVVFTIRKILPLGTTFFIEGVAFISRLSFAGSISNAGAATGAEAELHNF